MLRQFALVGLLLGSALGAAGPDAPVAPLPPGPTEPPILPRPVLADPPPAQSDQVEELLREAARLREERAALARERAKLLRPPPMTDTADSAELARLRRRMAELLGNLDMKQPGTPRTTVTDPPFVGPVHANPERDPPFVRTGPTTPTRDDPFLLAQAQFRAGEYELALAAYRRIDPESLSREERVTVLYLSACCLRKLNKLDDAAALYREVADAREDEFLTECALWQLSAIGWRRQVEKQLADMRKARPER